MRAIVALLVLLVNGCALVADREAEEIARHPSLARHFAARFPVGAALEPWQLGTRESKLLAWHFSSVVAENAMKPARLQPAEGRFDFSGADAIVRFAERHGMKVRGHTLVWGEQTPDWFFAGTREAVLERMRRHIAAVAGRYRGRVYAWDVVNEAIDPSAPGCLRQSRWLRAVGPDYIDHAFRFARAADPAAKLFINDFDTTEATKRECLLRLVRDLKARGVPVDGVGHQMHADLEKPTVAEVDATLGAFAALGVDNQVTELDVSLARAPEAGDAPALLLRQAARYEALFRTFAAHPDVKAVTLWGISDAHTWLNERRAADNADRPLLFDAKQEPKAAFWTVMSIPP